MSDLTIQIGHGGGGQLSSELIDSEIVSRFGNPALNHLPDAASLQLQTTDVLFSTDSFVVHPLEFSGGNIGHLAVHGTVNDISVSGGIPKWLSMGLILEEGLSLEVLRRVLDSVKEAVDECGVSIVTGDTKVVARGQCDGMYINTAGLGERISGFSLNRGNLQVGDVVLVSGPIGDHGLAVLANRESIHIENGPVSDTGSVHRLVQAIAPLADSVRFMRDPTRGGVAAVLNETVAGLEVGIELSQQDIPVSSGTGAVAEMLGLDPLNVACEGRMLLVCAADVSGRILDLWHQFPEGEGAVRIGEVVADSGRVTLRTLTGGRRLVDVPQGEMLPRIC